MAHPHPLEEVRAAPPPGDARRRWEANAGWWDDRVEEGNATQRTVVGPATERLLGPVDGRRLLDLGCGNGHFARRLADLGARVTALDFSDTFLDRARRRSAGYEGRIEFRSADLTEAADLDALAEGAFDAAVCTMALMDIERIEPIFRAVARAVVPDGPFVFSVTHPIFNQTGATRGSEESDADGRLELRHYLRVDRYLSGGPSLGLGIVGQPEGHWYFERPLGRLLGAGFDAGFVLDALEELPSPAPTAESRPLSWSSFPEIPPFLIARMRRPPMVDRP
jgi:SAM-dependent methyltransferase